MCGLEHGWCSAAEVHLELRGWVIAALMPWSISDSVAKGVAAGCCLEQTMCATGQSMCQRPQASWHGVDGMLSGRMPCSAAKKETKKHSDLLCDVGLSLCLLYRRSCYAWS